MATEKTFYLETFGCQMNAHDSEKVIGTLQQQGYRQVESEEEAGLILYNTCSIRDKAEQKVFNRLNDYKKLHKAGKRFGVLGCVAQQEGEKIFDRAPYVSLVSGSASYRKLPEMLARLEAGENAHHRAGRSPDRRDLRDRVHGAPEPLPRLHHHHRGLRQVLRLLRGAVHARQRAQPDVDSVLAEARRIADLGYTEIQLLGQNVNSYRDPEGKLSFAELLAAVGAGAGHPARALHHQPSARLYPGHRRSHRRRPDALRPCASAGAVGFVARVEDDGARVHAASGTWSGSAGSRRRGGPSRFRRTSSSAFRARRRTILSRRWTCSRKCSTIASSDSSTRRGPTRRRWR